MRSLLLATTALLLLAGQGLADEPAPSPSSKPTTVAPPATPWIQTASIETETTQEPASPPSALPPTPIMLPTFGSDADDNPSEVMGPCGPETVKPDGSVTRTAHGEVVAGIGSHGYNHQRVTVCKPIGKNTWSKTTVNRTQGGRR